MVKLPGRCFACHLTDGPSRVMPILQFLTALLLHLSVFVKHGWLPMFAKRCIRVPLHPVHLCTLGTCTTCCHCLPVIPMMASVHDCSSYSIFGPVVVLVRARPFSPNVSPGLSRGPVVWVLFLFILVSVCAPNHLPPGGLECRDYFDSWIERCAPCPNPIR